MSEEDLELLITLDDPGDGSEEDTFNHLQAEKTLEYWLSQRFPAGCRLDQRPEAVSNNDAYKVTFGQGDWTCTLSRLTGTTNGSTKAINGKVIKPSNTIFDIEVCTVTCSKNGEIVERKVFHNLVGVEKYFGDM